MFFFNDVLFFSFGFSQIDFFCVYFLRFGNIYKHVVTYYANALKNENIILTPEQELAITNDVDNFLKMQFRKQRKRVGFDDETRILMPNKVRIYRYMPKIIQFNVSEFQILCLFLDNK